MADDCQGDRADRRGVRRRYAARPAPHRVGDRLLARGQHLLAGAGLTPGEKAVAQICAQAEGGDAIALVGDNRRMLIVKLDDIPLMTRGRGVILQRYKAGGLADAKVFRLADGLSWRQGESRTRTETDLAPWLGARGAAGRLAPNGFPRSNRFG